MQSDYDDEIRNSQMSQKHKIQNERRVLGLSGEIRSKENKLKGYEDFNHLGHKISIDGPDSRDMILPRIGGSANQIPKINDSNKSKKLKLKNIDKLNLDIEAIEEVN